MVVSGIVLPPKEIRAVADRTAKFVAKNGRAFEARILKEKRAKTPKFAFLQPTSPFHPYYEDKIKFYEAGGKDEDEAAKAKAKAEAAEKEKETAQQSAKDKDADVKIAKKQKASVIDPIAKLLLKQREKVMQQRKAKETKDGDANAAADKDDAAGADADDAKPNPSPTEEQTVPKKPLKFDMVDIVPPASLSILQIETIQLVAQFTAMDVKGGPFLHHLSMREWNNSTFAFCRPRHAHFPYFSAVVDVYRGILKNWTDAHDVNDSKDNKDAKDATDTSTDATVQSLLEEVAFTAEFERHRKMQNEREDGELSAIDWQDFVVVETIDFAVDEVVTPLPPPPPVTGANDGAAKKSSGDSDGMDESDEDEEEAIRVVPSYTPKVVGTANVQAARAIDPITGKSVAVSDLPEHMRIQLLDPKWAEERKKFQDKQKDSNLVSDDVIAANISKFTAGREGSGSKTDASASKKRSAEPSLPTPAIAPTMPPAANPQARGAGAGSEPNTKRQKYDRTSGNNNSRGTGAGAGTASAGRKKPYRGPALLLPGALPGESSDNAVPQAAAPPAQKKEIVSAEEFAASLDSPDVTLQIRIPNDPSQAGWNFFGQMLSVTVPVTSKVLSVKEELSKTHLGDMPPKKIQLKDPSSGFLGNNKTLAKLNIGPTATLEMVPKTRGGRR